MSRRWSNPTNWILVSKKVLFKGDVFFFYIVCIPHEYLVLLYLCLYRWGEVFDIKFWNTVPVFKKSNLQVSIYQGIGLTAMRSPCALQAHCNRLKSEEHAGHVAPWREKSYCTFLLYEKVLSNLMEVWKTYIFLFRFKTLHLFQKINVKLF